MKTISLKIKLVIGLGIATILGVVLIANASIAESQEVDEANPYIIKSSATTNLSASMKAHPRASEYASAEYTSRVAPSASEASQYLAMNNDDGNNYQDYKRRTAPNNKEGAASTTTDGYTVKSAPTEKGTNEVAISGQRPAQSSSDTYQNYGVRAASTRNLEITESKSTVISADGYSRRRSTSSPTDYSGVVDNAQNNDNAYQTNQNVGESSEGGYTVRSAKGKDIATQQAGSTSNQGYAVRASTPQAGSADGYARKTAGAGESYSGYAVRSAGGRDVATAQESSTPSDETVGGYAVRSAGKGSKNVAQTSATPKARPISSGKSYEGYAVRSAGGRDVATAQGNSTPSGETVGGYAVRSAGKSNKNVAQQQNAQSNDNAYQVRTTPKANTSSSDESYGGYAVRSAGGRDVASTQGGSVSSGETVGGYAVRPAGGNKSKTRTSYADLTTPTPTPKPQRAEAGIKIYDNRGKRMRVGAKQMNRTVIVMPKTGRSIAGVVVQDDPGRNIVVQTPQGGHSTYRYGEIDALINL